MIKKETKMTRSQPMYVANWQVRNGMRSYRGPTIQRGYGLGGFFKGIARSFAPVLKRGLVNVGKKALRTGVEVLGDVAQEKKILSSQSKIVVKQI